MKSFEYTLEIDKEEETVLMNVRIDYRYDYEEEVLEIDEVYHFSDVMKMWIPVSYSVWEDFKDSIEDKINMLENKARRLEAETAWIDLTAGDVS